MSIEINSKINKLINTWPKGAVYLVKWLNARGYSNQLINKYKKNKWIESVGFGAVKRYADTISYESGLFALQNQAKLSIHPGGKTALNILGKAHFLEFNSNKITLFKYPGENIPKWFLNYNWQVKIENKSTSFLPANLGLTEIEINSSFKIKISSPARALMECLLQVPEYQDFVECYHLMESLNNLMPENVQEILENCTSVKVKRMFLYLSELSNHSWFKYLNFEKIDLGAGKISIFKNGKYIPKYKITVPRLMEKYEQSTL
jgi:hypothetical protein